MDGFDYSQLIPAITTGTLDGLNPCGAATMLMMTFLLAHTAIKPAGVFWYGLIYISAAVLTQIFAAHGVFDPILLHEAMNMLIQYAYVLFGIAFIFLALIHIYDWLRYKKFFDTACFKIPIPSYIGDSNQAPSGSKVIAFLTVLSRVCVLFLISALMTALSTIYPQSEYIFIVYSHMLAGGDMAFVQSAFVLYAITMCLPLILAWIAIWFMSFFREKHEKFISMYKVALSALMISAGGSLLYYFLN